MDITIRHARTEDIPRMSDLLAELFAIESDFTPDQEKQTRGLSALVADPSGRTLVIVAVSNMTVIGMATVQTLVSTAEGGRVGMIEDVIVDKKFRGAGVGSLLIKEILARSVNMRLKRLQLLADCGNRPALEFYASQGLTSTRLVCMRKMI